MILYHVHNYYYMLLSTLTIGELQETTCAHPAYMTINELP